MKINTRSNLMSWHTGMVLLLIVGVWSCSEQISAPLNNDRKHKNSSARSIKGQVLKQQKLYVFGVPIDSLAQSNKLLSKIKKRAGSSNVQVGQLKIISAKLLKKNYTISLPISPDKAVAVVGKRVSTRKINGTNYLSWIGPLKNGKGSASLVIGPYGVTGSLQVESTFYHLEPLKDGYQAVIRLEKRRTKPIDNLNPPFTIDSTRMDYIKVVAKRAKKINSKNRIKYMQPNELNSGPAIDVLIAYTAQAQDNVGDINATILNSINTTNIAFNNSDIRAHLRLAHAVEVNYNAQGHSWPNIAFALQDPSDGVMDNVHSLRNQYLGDVVVLLIARNPLGGTLGIAANLIPGNVHMPATSATAFAVASVFWVGGEGNPRTYTFAHEVGHIFGVRHNIDRDSHTQPFAYGHGYVHPSNYWHTIMAYGLQEDCNGCPAIQYYSNPDVNYSGYPGHGDPVGEEGVANNALVISLTKYTLRDFRTLDSPTNFTITNPNADGEYPHLTWTPQPETDVTIIYRCEEKVDTPPLGECSNPPNAYYHRIYSIYPGEPSEYTDPYFYINRQHGHECNGSYLLRYYATSKNRTGESDVSRLISVCAELVK